MGAMALLTKHFQGAQHETTLVAYYLWTHCWMKKL